MKIAILPSVRRVYDNQFELSVDQKIYNFFLSIFKNSKFKILDGQNNLNNIDLLVSIGGNSLINFSKKKEDLIRFKLDKKYFTEAKQKKIIFIGICHGAHFIASKYRSKFDINNKHVRKKHFINYNNKKIIVNSFHKIVIKSTGKKLSDLAFCEDKTIEFFKVKKEKIFGLVWHPERFLNFRKIDKDIIRTICS